MERNCAGERFLHVDILAGIFSLLQLIQYRRDKFEFTV